MKFNNKLVILSILFVLGAIQATFLRASNNDKSENEIVVGTATNYSKGKMVEAVTSGYAENKRQDPNMTVVYYFVYYSLLEHRRLWIN